MTCATVLIIGHESVSGISTDDARKPIGNDTLETFLRVRRQIEMIVASRARDLRDRTAW